MASIPVDKFCPEVLYGEGCAYIDSCPLEHDVYICELCVVVISPASKHGYHIRGPLHRQNLRLAGELPGRSGAVDRRRCTVCSMSVPADAWGIHLSAPTHKKHEQLAILRADYEQAEEDKQGVSVSHAEDGISFGVVSLEQAMEGVKTEVTVTTETTQWTTFLRTQVRSRISNHEELFTVTPHQKNSALKPDQPLVFTVAFRHNQLGRYNARLEFTFQTAGRKFIIARRLLVAVGDYDERELLKPVMPFARSRHAPWYDPDGPVLRGEAPQRENIKWARDMPHFFIPGELAEILRMRSPQDIIDLLRERCFYEELSQANHLDHFATLLWIEEDRMTLDLRMYDMADVEFTREGKGYLHSLHVHGLAEKRPSVTIGDTILVQTPGTGQTFKGLVHEIQDERVLVHFHTSFNATGMRYNVRFQLNRTTLRRQHQALVAKIPSPQRLLFPVPGFEGLDRPLTAAESTLELFNSRIGTNPEQLQAVNSILHLKTGSAPFVVFGPPGTGKTMTIVEAIQQIIYRDPKARVLACAPSNSAADILAQRLLALTQEELFRCNAGFREVGSVPSELMPYTYRSGRNFGLPSLDQLAKYKVIVSTCLNASFGYNIGLPEGHFTHIFVDEAGQASEAEVLVAIKPLALENTRIILSGDPKQLGPVIRSSIAREFGLEKSYLERLMDRPLYSGEHGRGTTYVKLTKNYRSHKAILRYPNEKFYDGELEVCGAASSIDAFLGSPQLASPEFPVMFHAISGRNEREASSPSYFNVDEAIQVKAYITSLLNDKRHPVEPCDIGVIVPYHAQVRKIRRLLKEGGLVDVKVGSVEEFQGQERRVIIVSTVRSSADLLVYDAKFTLGFLSNARRFNVAMTRAKALLVVVGDAAILCVDPLWRGFMNYVYQHKGWRGDTPTWDVNAPVCVDADYVDELRDVIAAEMNSVIATLPPEQDLEAEANVERGQWGPSNSTNW
ncbi:P-loop containing nucleoside triphosphate hydrolase protein [Lentinus tigrinus ALCF2SS1-7]|uniref:P-loop containing nucleoside triphosphate hydrolase protein n=1 Tax=Lentinus tigrinus ALCF2SS1-6 TaxID=1328759 RepID=A0A5C2RVB4_9APHY|nr:P-loop containing nucleoside triphosphate hydrolase protein [Lentinus tigrinus ALCF2SS1-6]RPD72514.1 P-loop containing nucleoside triphosphate hydrolase protein [Lentinus tigrinus ALCF2SS1-7]